MEDQQNKLRTSHRKAIEAINNVEARLETKVCLAFGQNFTARLSHLTLDEQATETENITETLSSLRNKEIARKQEIADCRTRIERQKAILETQPESVDTSALDKEIVRDAVKARGIRLTVSRYFA